VVRALAEYLWLLHCAGLGRLLPVLACSLHCLWVSSSLHDSRCETGGPLQSRVAVVVAMHRCCAWRSNKYPMPSSGWLQEAADQPPPWHCIVHSALGCSRDTEANLTVRFNRRLNY
jgi:hypothetical protein